MTAVKSKTRTFFSIAIAACVLQQIARLQKERDCEKKSRLAGAGCNLSPLAGGEDGISVTRVSHRLPATGATRDSANDDRVCQMLALSVDTPAI